MALFNLHKKDRDDKSDKNNPDSQTHMPLLLLLFGAGILILIILLYLAY